MPKIKVSPTQEQNNELVSRIRYGMSKQHLTHDELALAARMTRKTLYNRFLRPEQFSLSELRKISDKLRIPLLILLSTDDDFFKKNDGAC